MKKHAATIVLVLLALGLGVWLWLDRDRVTEGERKRRENSVFVVWRRDELSQITIAHDGETIVLQRDRKTDKAQPEGKEGLWRMTSPREERADPVAVERLLTTLEFAAVARRVGDGAAQGLDAPRVTGAVRMGGLEVPFALGGGSPQPEGSSYFRVGTDPPIVVGKEVADALLAQSDVYRDRAVVPYVAAELARIEIRHPGGSFAIERLDERAFRVAGGADAGLLASRQAVDRIWAGLAEMRAEAFAKEADVERLTAHPTVTIKLMPKDAGKPPAELVIGDGCPGHPADVIVLRTMPTRVAACAPKDVGTLLVTSGAALVEKHPFALRMDEIEELRLERTAPADAGAAGAGAPDGGAPPVEIEIARKGTGYRARAPFERDLSGAEAEAATDLLTRIASLEAGSVTRVERGGAFTFVARAKVRFGEHEQILEIGPPGPDGRAVARRVLDDARLELDPIGVRWLLPRATSLRSRALLEGETRRPARVVLRCGVDQELVDRGVGGVRGGGGDGGAGGAGGDEGFRLVTPAGYEADGSISQLIDAVLRGKVDGWVADADDGSFGFTPDGCHVTIAFEDGNAPVTLWFSGRESDSGGPLLARIDPRPGVFLAPRALRELAGRIYVSRGALRTDAARIERVRATLGGKPVVGRDPAALRDAAAALYADSVVALHDRPRGAPDLVIEVSVSEGGASRRIACWPGGQQRTCMVDGVDATFAVAQSKLAAFLPAADAAPPAP